MDLRRLQADVVTREDGLAKFGQLPERGLPGGVRILGRFDAALDRGRCLSAVCVDADKGQTSRRLTQVHRQGDLADGHLPGQFGREQPIEVAVDAQALTGCPAFVVGRSFDLPRD